MRSADPAATRPARPPPIPTAVEAFAPLRPRRAAGFRSIEGELALSGRAGGERVRGRVLTGLEAGGAVRLEAPAPFGAPFFILAGRDERATLLLPRERRVLKDTAGLGRARAAHRPDARRRRSAADRVRMSGRQRRHRRRAVSGPAAGRPSRSAPSVSPICARVQGTPGAGRRRLRARGASTTRSTRAAIRGACACAEPATRRSTSPRASSSSRSTRRSITRALVG